MVGLGSAEWVQLGPDGTLMHAMTAAPGDGQVAYAAVNDQPDFFARVYRTSDRGRNWELRGQIPYRDVYSMAVSWQESDVVYATTYYSNFYWSTDGGGHWNSSTLPYSGNGMMVKADPFIPGRVYVAGAGLISSTYRMALFISGDYGRNWQTSVVDSGYSVGHSCLVSVVDSGTWYVGGTNGMVKRSTDGGANWVLCNSGLPVAVMALALDQSRLDPNLIIAGTDSGGVYRTTDRGASWSITGFMKTARNLVLSPADPRYGYCGVESVYATTNSGASWFRPMPGLAFKEIGGFAANPDSGEMAFVCGTNGVYQTSDHGVTWQPASQGIRAGRISCIAVSPWNADNVYLEIAENGVYKSSSGGASWTRCADFLACGDICGIAVLPGAGAEKVYALEGKG